MPPPTDDILKTPMLRQYWEIKEQHKDAILFYRIGDFYEMFFEDAVVASRVLDITLTSRNKNDPNPVPLCGVPWHSSGSYLEKLLSKGFKVAICDQVEDPQTAKGVVRREVTRVVTPGLTSGLEGADTLSGGVEAGPGLVAIHPGEKTWGIAVFEMATGYFRVMEVPRDFGNFKSLIEELEKISPKEIIIAENFDDSSVKLGERFFLSRLPDWVWDESFAKKVLGHQFQTATLSGFQCDDLSSAVIAAGAILHYAKQTQKVDRFLHITSLKRTDRSETMPLSEESRKNLSLDELLELMDHTKTALGKRKLREWLYAPLRNKPAIEKRLDAVEEIIGRKVLSGKLQQLLEKVYDLQKISSRLSLGTVHARDLRSLAGSLLALDEMKPLLSEFSAAALREIADGWNSLNELQAEIETTIVDDPPLALKEGGLIRDGVSKDLDELRKLKGDAKGALLTIEEREKKRTGISSLKIHFNRVFGYYLEVTATHREKVPSDYIRKQTLANAERFITPELKEFEDKILGADEKIKALEYEIFTSLKQKALERVVDLQNQADRVGPLDAFLSLATYAFDHRTVRPQIEDSGVLFLRQGRHPIVEKSIPTGSFIPNDLSMDVEGDRLLMITGPNMAGKSTSIRQCGVIVLMAQMGSFVPALEARIGVADQIFTRVGASDRLARGESTFMVEMCETASILHYATEKSLVLLDEIGRGTSTFDGISIAWSVAEYLHDKIRARTLFATHYHELAELSVTRAGVKNYHVEVKDEEGEIVFLYRLVPGAMSHSYGLHVAKLAGIPQTVIERAKEVLKNLEEG